MKSKGQEEIVGFALIIIIVGVLLLIFLGFTLTQPQEIVASYEVESFIQAILQYTTNCAENYEPEYDSVRKLITACNNKEKCTNGDDSCKILENTIENIMSESWNIQRGGKIQGYELIIITNNKTIISLEEGNKTNNFQGAMQDFRESLSGTLTEIYINIYE